LGAAAYDPCESFVFSMSLSYLLSHRIFARRLFRKALACRVLWVRRRGLLTHLIANLLFGVKNWDPAVFVSVPVLLSLVALLAVWLPAMRASRLNPIEALRTE
jgi:ABC-type lipoprotein release transport system permease subunit